MLVLRSSLRSVTRSCFPRSTPFGRPCGARWMEWAETRDDRTREGNEPREWPTWRQPCQDNKLRKDSPWPFPSACSSAFRFLPPSVVWSLLLSLPAGGAASRVGRSDEPTIGGEEWRTEARSAPPLSLPSLTHPPQPTPLATLVP